jgi:hypothetical protein
MKFYSEVMVGEQGAVAEVVFTERRRLEHAAKLVELLQTVAAGPGEPADGTQLPGADGLAGHGEAQRTTCIR